MNLEAQPPQELVPAQQPAPLPRMTFRELLTMMASIDQVDDIAEFDPAVLVGDLRDKVDDINYVLQRMETVAAFLKEYVAPIDRKRRSIELARERLRDYVARSMRGDYLPDDVRQRTEQIPGNVYFVRLRDSNPALKVKRPATAADMLDYPQYVEMERRYVWKTDALKDALLAGTIQECNFAEITRGVWPEWKLKIPATLEKKRVAKGGVKS